jgi:UDP-glucose 4-epimerase
VSLEDPIFDADVNIKGSLNLLENCLKNRVKRFIFSSTGGAIYGEADIIPTPETYKEQPLCPYGITKLSLEKYLFYYQKQYGLNFCALRYANVYGPRQDPKGEAGVVAIFSSKLLAGQQPIINGDGRQTRDYVYVADVIEANFEAFRQEKNGIYNIGTAQETSVNELYQIINKTTKTKAPEKHGSAIRGEQLRSCLDYTLARKELSWQPRIKLTEGIKLTIDYFMKQVK